MFKYEDEEFSAKNLNHACTKFLDEAWGNHYVQHLKDSGLDSSHIGAIEDLEEINDENYYRLKQKLENGAVFQIEVWMNDDETYSGLAQEITGPLTI